ncbi:hypothetical protein [Methylotenera sp.]|uniref:hypothetical protein n=1 Tax=Methylotenera sp. TaxID=2051956 RepID=UPI002ED99EA0
MNLQIAENTDVSTVQTMINEAIALGLRVVHRPDSVNTNVVSLEDRRQMMAHTSPEAA